jgi:type II secretory pathway predicted ATPase ExeA
MIAFGPSEFARVADASGVNQVYTEFYGLHEKPFALLADPRFLYLGSSHREVLANLVRGIEERERFMIAVGGFGTGKTTLCHTLVDRVGADVDVALILTPGRGPAELIRAIHREFGFHTDTAEAGALIGELRESLRKGEAAGRRKVVVIDEAQQLSPECLQQVHALHELEAGGEPLLQIALIGEPSLQANLAESALRELQQRCAVRELRTLDGLESMQYVEHRLRVAGRRGHRPLFTHAALRALQRAAAGTPRAINAIADRALLASGKKRRTRIGASAVRRAAAEERSEPQKPSARRRPALALAAVSILVAAGYGTSRIAQDGWAENLLERSRALVASALPARAALQPAYSATAEGPDLGSVRPLLLERGTRGSAADALAKTLELRGSAAAALPREIDPEAMDAALRGVSPLHLAPRQITLAASEVLELPLILEVRPASDQLGYVALARVSLDRSAVIFVGERAFVLPAEALSRYSTGRSYSLTASAPEVAAAQSAAKLARTRPARALRP